MSRRKKTPATPAPAAVAERPSIPGDVLGERILVGGLTALMVARPLVAGDDPGRLRLTAGAGPLALNALTLMLLLGWAVWRGRTKRPLASSYGWVVAAGLLLTAVCVFISAAGPDRYGRPGWFIAWDWVSIAALCFLASQLATSDAVTRGLTAVLLATAIALAAQALYQESSHRLGLPSTEIDPQPPAAIPLVGDEEPGRPTINQPPRPLTPFRATFDQPDTLAGFLLLLLPAAAVFGLVGWRAGGPSRAAPLVLILLLLATGFAIHGFLYTNTPRPGGRQIVWDLIRRYPLLGVGPGNFSRHWGNHGSPADFWAGLAATTGILALAAAVLTALAVVVLGVRERPAAEAGAEPPRRGARWEFYFGGVAGLLLGMMFATGDIPAESSADEMLRLGAVAAGRALVWFLAFGLLESVLPAGIALRRALLAGVVFVGFFGLMSDGLASPALAQPFWLTATLALAIPATKRDAAPLPLPCAWAAVPVALALLIANVVHVGVPGYATASAVAKARAASKDFPHRVWRIEGKRGPDWVSAVREADGYVVRNVVEPLHSALKFDPDNSALLVERARWGRWHWRFQHQLGYTALANDEGTYLLKISERAAQIDPHNLAGRLATFETLLLFATESAPVRKEHLTALDKVIGQIAEHEPVLQVSLRYRVVQLLLGKKGNRADLDAWAVKVLTLDREDSVQYGILRDEERASLIERLKATLERPSPELAAFLIGQ